MKGSLNYRRRLLGVLSAAAIVLGLVASTPAHLAQASEKDRNPGILPPNSKPYGMSYGEWSNAWWQWAFSIPVPAEDPQSHPLFNETGANCGVAQTGPVWFLGGVFNVSGTAHRDGCIVPSGKALFSPIMNVECSNVEGNGMTEAELRACANGIGVPPNMRAEVDGVSIENLLDYRVGLGSLTPPGFNFTLPNNNLFQFFGLDAPAGNCYYPVSGGGCVPYLSVGDGYYLMLAPLSAGRHTIHFAGGDPNIFALDVTYDPLIVR